MSNYMRIGNIRQSFYCLQYGRQPRLPSHPEMAHGTKGFDMLREFLTSNRAELITRCRNKVAKRFAPSEIPIALDHGVPLFLQQLVETLRLEQSEPILIMSGRSQHRLLRKSVAPRNA